MSETYDKRLDGERLGKQLAKVHEWTLKWGSFGKWVTLSEISGCLGYPEASISARLRDLRRLGYVVEKRRRGNPKAGVWEYKCSKPVLTQQRLAFIEASASRSCDCRFTDSWRCAVSKQLRTVACPCKCHRYITDALAEERKSGKFGEKIATQERA